MFINLTGHKGVGVCVNMDLVEFFMDEKGPGSAYLFFVGGDSMPVKETLEEIQERMAQAVENKQTEVRHENHD